MKQVAVIGSSTALEDSEEYRFAYKIGKILGERGNHSTIRKIS